MILLNKALAFILQICCPSSLRICLNFKPFLLWLFLRPPSVAWAVGLSIGLVSLATILTHVLLVSFTVAWLPLTEIGAQIEGIPISSFKIFLFYMINEIPHWIILFNMYFLVMEQRTGYLPYQTPLNFVLNSKFRAYTAPLKQYLLKYIY